MTWTPSNEELAQGLHVALGGVFTFLPYVLRWKYPWLGAVAIIAFAVLKDFSFDLLVEHDTPKGSMVDVAFYVLGVVIAALIVRYGPYNL